MAKTRLLPAVCTIAMLAAVPAFAQNTPATPAPDAGNSKMAPANDEGSAGATHGSPMNEGRTMHHSSMGHHAMQSRNATSQDAEVDRLNQESYEAAQKGQVFSANGSDASGSGTMMPNAKHTGPLNGSGTPGSNSTINSTGGSPTGSGANEPK